MQYVAYFFLKKIVVRVCRTLGESFIGLHAGWVQCSSRYKLLVSSSCFLIWNQRHVSESDSFPSVNDVAVKSRMPRFPLEKFCSAVGYTVFEDLGVTWIDIVIRWLISIVLICWCGLDHHLRLRASSKSFCFPRYRNSLQQHTWQYIGPSQSLTSFSLSFGTQQRTQIDLFPFVSYFNNLELMRFVMELHPWSVPHSSFWSNCK